MTRWHRPAHVRMGDKINFDGPNGCWEWTAARTGKGYGAIQAGVDFGGGLLVAHRLVFESVIGPVPEGLQLDHLCRNRACVNPEHLEPVTCKENLLRGEGPNGRYGNATHCAKGHEYTVENTYVVPRRGTRQCKTCRAGYALAHKERIRKAISA